MTMLSHMLRRAKGGLFRYAPGMISCETLDDFILDYLDGALPAHQRRVFEWHIRLCRECRDYLAAYRRSIALGKSAQGAPGEMPEDLVRAILSARTAED